MEVKGKIIGFEPDFSTHKPKLILELTRQDNLEDLFKLREEPMLDIKISKPTQKRSRDANSYAWVLMGQIAELINSTKEDVYKEYIRQNGIYREITLNNEAVNTFTHLWTERGLGWICEYLQSDLKETTLVFQRDDQVPYYQELVKLENKFNKVYTIPGWIGYALIALTLVYVSTIAILWLTHILNLEKQYLVIILAVPTGILLLANVFISYLRNREMHYHLTKKEEKYAKYQKLVDEISK